MSSSRSGKPSRRTIILSAGLGAVIAVMAWVGIETLTETRYPRSCSRIPHDLDTTLRVSYSDVQCVVMANPVPVDSDPASLTVTPNLLNGKEVFRALVKSMRGQSAEDTGEGEAIAHFLVDEAGVVRQQRIAESSGHEALDEAVLALASQSTFSPAEDEEGATEAWVALRVGFGVGQSPLQRLQQQLERWRKEATM